MSEYAEGAWKISVYSTDGKINGYFEPAHCGAEQMWPGNHGARVYEVLFRFSDGYYLLLRRFNQKRFTEEDYARQPTRTEVARWLDREGYDRPPDLVDVNPSAQDGSVEEWSIGYTIAKIAEKISCEAKRRTVEKRLMAIGSELKPLANRQSWKVRLDTMERAYRVKF